MERMMFRKTLVAVSFVAAFSMPALAASQYWVAKNASTKKCEVVDKKPDGTKFTDVGTKAYDSKENADKALKMLTACK